MQQTYAGKLDIFSSLDLIDSAKKVQTKTLHRLNILHKFQDISVRFGGRKTFA